MTKNKISKFHIILGIFLIAFFWGNKTILAKGTQAQPIQVQPTITKPSISNEEIVNDANKVSESIKEKTGIPKSCKGIKLNTNVPFVGNCIGVTKDNTSAIDAFPKLMGAMMKLLMTVILVMSLLMIVVAGVMISSSGGNSSNYKSGMDIIKKVAIGIALLGASGVILKFINPNFFV